MSLATPLHLGELQLVSVTVMESLFLFKNQTLMSLATIAPV